MTIGRLVPHVLEVLTRAFERMQELIADLRDGESFSVRFSMVRGKLEVTIDPKRIVVR